MSHLPLSFRLSRTESAVFKLWVLDFLSFFVFWFDFCVMALQHILGYYGTLFQIFRSFMMLVCMTVQAFYLKK